MISGRDSQAIIDFFLECRHVQNLCLNLDCCSMFTAQGGSLWVPEVYVLQCRDGASSKQLRKLAHGLQWFHPGLSRLRLSYVILPIDLGLYRCKSLSTILSSYDHPSSFKFQESKQTRIGRPLSPDLQ